MKPFVIVTTPRTGCSYLLDLYNEVYKTKYKHHISLYEFFGRHKIQRSQYRLPYLQNNQIIWKNQTKVWDDTDQNWDEEIERRIDLLQSSSIPYVFKVFPSDLQNEKVYQFIKSYRLIALERQNTLEHFLSTAKANITDIWNGREAILAPMVVSRDLYDKFLNEQTNYHNYKKLLDVQTTIYYEMFENNSQFIYDFFSLPDIKVTLDIRKNAQRTGWVSNLEDVRSWMQETR